MFLRLSDCRRSADRNLLQPEVGEMFNRVELECDEMARSVHGHI
jgi:hypothetical protein